MRRALALLAAAAPLAGCGGSGPRPARAHASAGARPAQHAARPAAPTLGPNPLRGAAARHAPVPILMYHVISAAPAGVPYPDLFVPGARFAAEMAALHAAGFRATTLDAVLAAWRSGAPLPRHPVVVSFDDGYLSQYTHALPALHRLGWPGVLNLEVNNLRAGDLPAPLVRRMIRAGWEVDAHTLTHPDLTTVPAARLAAEVAGSGRRIRRQFGVAARNFCYPAGRFDAMVEAEVRRAGYAAATTTQPGWATPGANRYALPRIRVHATDTPTTLLRAIQSSRPG